jgi:hypothetical protein
VENKLLRLAVFVVSLFIASSAQADGPFGMTPGTKINELIIKREVAAGRFSIEVSRGHPEFESYIVTASDTHGVCSITGIGKDYDNDRFGINVREAFDKLRAQMERRYGKGEEVFFLRSGALWDGLNEWVMSIKQNERAHQLSWEKGTNIADDTFINDILLTVKATSSDTAYLTLQYRFTNIEACREEIDRASEGSL